MAILRDSEPRTRNSLSKAEKRRREQRKKIKKYPSADFSKTGPDPEPALPIEISADVVAYILEELRRAVRNRKKIYGARLCDTLQHAFGLLKAADAKRVTDWINWLVRNRHELIVGKYRPGFSYEGPSVAEPASKESPTQSSALSQTETGIGGNALDRELPFPVLPKDVLEAVSQPQSLVSLGGRSGTTSHVQSPEQLDRPEVRAAAPSDHAQSGEAAAHDLATDSMHLAASARESNITIKAASNAAPKMPAKPTFRFRQDGAQKANRFLGAIYFNEPLEKVREHAIELAADQNALNDAMNRGSSVREFILQAMQDLAVDLP